MCIKAHIIIIVVITIIFGIIVFIVIIVIIVVIYSYYIYIVFVCVWHRVGLFASKLMLSTSAWQREYAVLVKSTCCGMWRAIDLLMFLVLVPYQHATYSQISSRRSWCYGYWLPGGVAGMGWGGLWASMCNYSLCGCFATNLLKQLPTHSACGLTNLLKQLLTCSWCYTTL